MTEAILSRMEKNVAGAERWASAIVGGALTAYGLKSRSAGGAVLAAAGAALVWRAATGHCFVYESLGISTARDGENGGRHVSVPYGRGVRMEKSVTIDAPREQVFAFWRNFENLPRFMNNLEEVQVHDARRSRWVARGPAGTSVDWEAEIINEVPLELIGWRSIDGSVVDNAGSVHFSPTRGGRGTEVKVVLRYDPPAGVAGAKLSKLLGEDPAANVEEDLRRLKTLLETGQAQEQ